MQQAEKMFGKIANLLRRSVGKWILLAVRSAEYRAQQIISRIRDYRPPSKWEWLAVALLVSAWASFLCVVDFGYRAPVGAFIAVVAGLAAAVTFRKEPPPIEKALWIAIIGILTATEIHGLYVADKEQAANFNQVSRSLIATREGLESTARGLDIAANRLDGISGQINDSSNASNAKFDATLDRIREAINTETGGNSFCYLQAMRTTESEMQTAVLSVGQYPLYAVGMRVVDAKYLRSTKDIPKSELVSTDLGDLYPPHSARVASPVIRFAAPGDDQSLNIFFTGRNGWWTELWRIHKVNGEWKYFMAVTGSLDTSRYPRGAILMQASSKDFPKDILENDIEWQQMLKSRIPRAKYSQ